MAWTAARSAVSDEAQARVMVVAGTVSGSRDSSPTWRAML
jgi:hypothetical protein